MYCKPHRVTPGQSVSGDTVTENDDGKLISGSSEMEQYYALCKVETGCRDTLIL